MTRDLLTAELSRLEVAKPSAIARFNEARTARIAEIKAALAALPAEPVVIGDAALDAMLARCDAGSRQNRAAARWR